MLQQVAFTAKVRILGKGIFKTTLHFFLLRAPFLVSFSTSTQPLLPRVQTTVSPPSKSGTVHLMSSGVGQGHLPGSGTQVRVCGQRYSEHETKYLDEKLLLENKMLLPLSEYAVQCDAGALWCC